MTATRLRAAARALIAGSAAQVASACGGAHTAPRSAADAADSAFVREHYTKRQYQIPMRDGAHLFTIVYVPNDASPTNRYPIVMQRTPFGVAPYGPDVDARTLGPDRFMMREQYIFVYQDVRGRYMSEGTFVNMRPILPDSVKRRDPTAVDEATDTYDTIDWLLTHVPENNGKVGQWGISYAGFFASLGALSRHPALVASSPQAPVTDAFFEDFHHNGALTQAYFYAYPVFGIPRPVQRRRTGGCPNSRRSARMASPTTTAPNSHSDHCRTPRSGSTRTTSSGTISSPTRTTTPSGRHAPCLPIYVA